MSKVRGAASSFFSIDLTLLCSVLSLPFSFVGASTANAQSSGPGQALSFTAENQNYVVIREAPDLNPYPLTVTAWVKTAQTTGSAGLINKYISAALNGWQVYLLNGEVRAWYFADSDNYVWDGGDGLDSGVIADGAWHFIAFTVDGSGGKLYVDGSLRASRGWTGTPNEATSRRPLVLGYYPGVGPNFLTGVLDEITLWNTNLSLAQIQANMHQSLSGNSAGLVLYLRLDDAPGNVVYDSTSHGHNGILVNSPAWVNSTAPLVSTAHGLTVEPLSRIAEAGTFASFSVGTGTVPSAYQWRFNGQDIPGATDSTLPLPKVTPADAGTYDALVSNSSGSVTSSPAQLSVITTPEVLTQPIGDVANVGASVSFDSQTIGGRPLTQLWFHDGTFVSSGTNSALSLNSVSSSDEGNYQLIVTNAYGAVTSSVAVLKVHSGSISDDLVVHLAFDGDFADTAGAHNDGRYVHNGARPDPGPRFTTGVIGQAFQYTTSSAGGDFDYATLGYPPDLRFGSNDFSISFWVNYSTQGGDLPFLSNKDWNRSHNPGWSISAQSAGTFRVNLTGADEGQDMYSTALTPVVKDHTWHHIVVSALRVPPSQSGFVSVYLDGTLVRKDPASLGTSIDTFGLPFTYASPVSSSQTNWAVNIGQDGTGVYFDFGNAYAIGAEIDDLGIWRRALTAEEAKGIYKAGLSSLDLTHGEEYPTLRFTLSHGSVSFHWPANPAVKLQMSPGLTPPSWTDVPGSLGQSSVDIPMGISNAFFRLAH